MPPILNDAPDEESLLDSIAFFRRMGNYLFLPLFIVFGFCTAFMVLSHQGPWRVLLGSNFFLVYLTLAVAGFVLWRLSRRPRPPMLFAVGLILATIDLIWAVWLIYLILIGKWKDILFRVEYALAVLIGIGGASLKCFQLWNLFRRVDTTVLDVAFRRIMERN
jgi:hypothetical protein